MDETNCRQMICETGRRLYDKGMCTANDGNISVRLGDGNILCTPTGVCKGYMDPDTLPVVTPEGEPLKARPGFLPSSEIKMHLAVYKNVKEARAVVHAHPPYATTFAAAGLSLEEPVLIESVEQFGCVPCVRYAAPSTDELALSIVPYLEQYRALLLEFHGALTVAASLTKAWMKMESLEFYAGVLYRHRLLGSENRLDEARVKQLLEIKEKLGIE